MSQAALPRQAEDYLRRLRQAAQALTPTRREELVQEIRGHLIEAISPGASDAEVLTALERLGAPEEIVEAEHPVGPAVAARDQRTWREWGAVILLPLGGIVLGIGWLVGLVLLWSSRLWTTRDKVIGTLILPGGILFTPFVLLLLATKRRCAQYTRLGPALEPHVLAQRCTPGPTAGATVWHVAVIALCLLAPFACAVHLARRAGMSLESP